MTGAYLPTCASMYSTFFRTSQLSTGPPIRKPGNRWPRCSGAFHAGVAHYQPRQPEGMNSSPPARIISSQGRHSSSSEKHDAPKENSE